MVAPYEIGEPIQSFVRVTGTGSGKPPKSIAWDLARGSTAAGAVSVPQSLPPATPIDELLKTDGYAQENGTTEQGSSSTTPGESSTSQASGRSQSSEASKQQAVSETGARKRRCNDESESSENGTLNSSEPPQKSARVDTSQVGNSTGASTSQPSETQTGKIPPAAKKVVLKVLHECIHLRKENRELQEENKKLKAIRDKEREEVEELRQQCKQLEERLTRFHNLFRDKKRLAEFLKTLSVSAQ